jgi:hypothetical protein
MMIRTRSAIGRIDEKGGGMTEPDKPEHKLDDKKRRASRRGNGNPFSPTHARSFQGRLVPGNT